MPMLCTTSRASHRVRPTRAPRGLSSILELSTAIELDSTCLLSHSDFRSELCGDDCLLLLLGLVFVSPRDLLVRSSRTPCGLLARAREEERAELCDKPCLRELPPASRKNLIESWVGNTARGIDGFWIAVYLKHGERMLATRSVGSRARRGTARR